LTSIYRFPRFQKPLMYYWQPLRFSCLGYTTWQFVAQQLLYLYYGMLVCTAASDVPLIRKFRVVAMLKVWATLTKRSLQSPIRIMLKRNAKIKFQDRKVSCTVRLSECPVTMVSILGDKPLMAQLDGKPVGIFTPEGHHTKNATYTFTSSCAALLTINLKWLLTLCSLCNITSLIFKLFQWTSL